jgi:hypothetical protein
VYTTAKDTTDTLTISKWTSSVTQGHVICTNMISTRTSTGIKKSSNYGSNFFNSPWNF